MEAFTFNTVELILLSAAGILFIIQLIYYFGLYNRIHIRNIALLLTVHAISATRN